MSRRTCELLEVHLSLVQAYDRSARFGDVLAASAVIIHVDSVAGLQICRSRGWVRQASVLRALFGHDRQVPRRAEATPPAWSTVADPVRR
jgi:hypothetical protein